MRYSTFLITILTLVVSSLNEKINAQDQSPEINSDTVIRNYTFTHGLDISNIAYINPRVGAGNTQINIGGSLGFQMDYLAGNTYFQGAIDWQFGTTRIGAGGGNIPWIKTSDQLSLYGVYARRFKTGSKFYYSIYGSATSQVTPTYQGNLLLDNTDDNNLPLVAQFFSPVRFEFAPNIFYLTDNRKLMVYYTPIGYKSIVVANDSIAALGIHGNPVELANGLITSYENADHQFGSFLRIAYLDQFFNRLNVSTDLTLFSNYLNHPERVDVEWKGDVSVVVYKNIQIGLNFILFYDYDVQVQKSDFNIPAAQWELGRGVSFTQQFQLRYQLKF